MFGKKRLCKIIFQLLDERQTEALYKAKESKERLLKQIRFVLTMGILVAGLALIIPDRLAALIAAKDGDASCERYHYL